MPVSSKRHFQAQTFRAVTQFSGSSFVEEAIRWVYEVCGDGCDPQAPPCEPVVKLAKTLEAGHLAMHVQSVSISSTFAAWELERREEVRDEHRRLQSRVREPTRLRPFIFFSSMRVSK